MNILLLFFICLLIFISIRIPIYVCLGLIAIVIWFTEIGGLTPSIYIQRMFAGLDSFTLMAIPFFMLCGDLMNAGGLSKRLVIFVNDLFGWVRGGLGFTVILAGVFVAAILGSSSASAALIGMVMIPEMINRGYRKEFSAALVAASGSLGPIIPPSMVLIVYGVLAEVSVTSLFIAGYIPGLIIAGLFMIYTYIHSRKHNYPAGDMPSFSKIIKSGISAFPTLVLPIIIMGGILSGIFTPTEAGVIGAVYALLIGLLYREIKLSEIPSVFISAANKTGMILVVISTAGLLCWVLTLVQIPQTISRYIIDMSVNKYMFLLLVNILLLIMGMFVDSISAITIVAPVLLPTVFALGIDPVFFGVLIAVNITIGGLTPPVGLNLYVTSSIAKINIFVLSKACLPFVIMMIFALAIMVLFPQSVTFFLK